MTCLKIPNGVINQKMYIEGQTIVNKIAKNKKDKMTNTELQNTTPQSQKTKDGQNEPH